MTDTDDLVERLEKLTGPDRELDADVARAAGWKLRKTGFGDDWITPDGNCVGLPRYTASIDAAMTLVPKGWAWSVHVGGCYATGRLLRPRAELAEPVQTEFGPGIGMRAQVEAATPAIALVIAALRARSPR